jgi:lipopolysaccharide biosynthesis glycosyltransferase
LYVDVDTIIRKDINGILKDNDKGIAAVKGIDILSNVDDKVKSVYEKEKNFTGEGFNSGIVLIQKEKIRANIIESLLFINREYIEI